MIYVCGWKVAIATIVQIWNDFKIEKSLIGRARQPFVWLSILFIGAQRIYDCHLIRT